MPNTSPFNAEQKTVAMFPILADISMRIVPTQNGVFIVEFRDSTQTLVSHSVKTPPWLSVKIQRELVGQLHQHIPPEHRPDLQVLKSRLIECFDTIRKKLESDPDVRRNLTSPNVRKVIECTVSVDIYPGQITEFIVTVLNGDSEETLQFTPSEITETGKALNVKWLNAFPKDPIYTTLQEWREIVGYWTETATIYDKETANELDYIIERLQEHLSTIIISTDDTALVSMKYGWWDESSSDMVTVWIPGAMIATFLKDIVGKDGAFSGILAKELKRRNFLTTVSTPLRITDRTTGKSIVRKCWAFTPEFGQFTRESCIDPARAPKEVKDAVD